MKINIIKEQNLKENHLDLHYEHLDEETKAVKQYLSALSGMISGYEEETKPERMLLPGEILYLEIVDRKTSAYLKDGVWRIDFGLQQFLDDFGKAGFVRTSKSMLVNIYHIRELKAELNMRVHILMDNGETAYRDMFLSVSIPYIVLAGLYYIFYFKEVKTANENLGKIKLNN